MRQGSKSRRVMGYKSKIQSPSGSGRSEESYWEEGGKRLLRRFAPRNGEPGGRFSPLSLFITSYLILSLGFCGAEPNHHLATSFWTFYQVGGMPSSALNLNYQFSRYELNLGLSHQQRGLGLRGFSLGIDSIVKDFRLIIGEKPQRIPGIGGTTLPLWGLVFAKRGTTIFLGKTEDAHSSSIPTFQKNRYTVGFEFAPYFSRRIPVTFSLVRKSDTGGYLPESNFFGVNAQTKIGERFSLNSDLGASLSHLGVGGGFLFGANYTGKFYRTSGYFKKVFQNFVTPANLLTAPGYWVSLYNHLHPLRGLSLNQDLSYSNTHDLNLGAGIEIRKPHLPSFGYGVKFSQKSKLIGQSVNSEWSFKGFSISGDYGWSALGRQFALRLGQSFKEVQIWSRFQLDKTRVYQFGWGLPFSQNLGAKGFLNLYPENGAVRSTKGVELLISRIGNFNMNVRYEWLGEREHQISMSLTNTLLFEQTGLSFISGKVFMDLNNNGVFDREDQVVPDVEVILDRGEVVRTDRQGNFQFSFVPTGEHKLNLNLGAIPADIGPEKRQKEVSTKLLSKVRVNFPLGKLGVIEGFIYYDENKNGRFDPDEPGVPNAVIGLNGYLSTTDRNGRFRFANLPSGTYLIEPKVLPPETNLTVSGPIYIHIEPGGEVKGYNIGVVKKERPVIKKEFNNNRR